MDVHLVLFWFYTQNIELFEQRTKSKKQHLPAEVCRALSYKYT